ncbi:tRNA (adenosine(37)-N6)-dimethylallyltransferase MiaA [Bacteroidota bacterium]
MSVSSYNLITVLGATASGKTSFASNLAYKLKSEIISADSRQVYKRMDIGTGKDYMDYIVNGKKIPYHIIDILDAGGKYNVYDYQRDFLIAFNNISTKKKIPILCGGSGMYIEAAVKAYKLIEVPPDEDLRTELDKKSLEELTKILKSSAKLHNTSDILSKKRAIRAIEIQKYYDKHSVKETEYPVINNIFLGIKFDRDSRRKRISERLKQRFDMGMTDEVKSLLDSGIKAENLIYYGLEYKHITNYLIGNISYNRMFAELETAIHQFAKRQMTWFRRMEKMGEKIHWIDGYKTMEEKTNIALNLLVYSN